MRSSNKSGIEFIHINSIESHGQLYQYWTVSSKSRKHPIPKKNFEFSEDGLKQAKEYLHQAAKAWTVGNSLQVASS